VFLSLCYVVLQRVLQIVALRVCSNDFKELEIVVLRHELAILRRRTRRPPMTWTDRLFLAAASRSLPRARWRSFIILSDGRRLFYTLRGKLFVLDSVSKGVREVLSVAPDDFDSVALSRDNRTIYFTRARHQGDISLMTLK
jgi:hypothetical protein